MANEIKSIKIGSTEYPIYPDVAKSANKISQSTYYYSDNVMKNDTSSQDIFGVNAKANFCFPAFMEKQPIWNEYADVLNFTGYCKWGGTQIASQYNSSNPRVAIRKFVQNSSLTDGGSWGNWNEFVMFNNVKSTNSISHSEWSAEDTGDRKIATLNFLSYWNGAHTAAGGSNLQYCDRGRFGTIVTKAAGDYLPISGGVLTENLSLIKTLTSDNYRQVYNAGSIAKMSNSVNGAIVIELPLTSPTQHDMINVEISVYEYNTYSTSKIIIGGHPWQGNWYNHSCSVIGKYNKAIKLGIYNNHYCIILGNIDTTWNYPIVAISHIATGYDTYSKNYKEKCTLSFVTTDSFTNVVTPTNSTIKYSSIIDNPYRSRYLESLNETGDSWFGDNYKFFTQWTGAILDLKCDGYETRVDRAKKLNTTRSIFGQNFDGTADIPANSVGYMRYLLFRNADNNDNVGYIGRGSSGNAMELINYTENNLDLGTNGSVRARITGAGKIMLGSSSNPSYKVDIKNTANEGYDFHVYNSSNKSSFYVGKDSLWYGTPNTGSTKIFYLNSGTTSDGSGGSQVFTVNGDGQTRCSAYSLSNTDYHYCGLVKNSLITTGGNSKDIWLYNDEKVSVYGKTVSIDGGEDVIIKGLQSSAFMGRLYAESPYQFNGSNPYYARLRYNINSDSRWYLSVYPETPKEIAVDYATKTGSASYSRNLLGRNTNGTDYGATTGNLVFAEWNTHGDNRWYLKAEGYETRVGYANSAGSAPASDVYSWAKAATKPTYTASEVGAATSGHSHTSFASAVSFAAGLSSSANVTVTGKVSATQGFYEESDERLKSFKDPIKVDLEKLSKLRKSYFTFNSDPDNLQIGVSAQEIQSLYPEIVSENKNGNLTVAYDKLSVIALAAVDQLSTELNTLKDELQQIKAHLNLI